MNRFSALSSAWMTQLVKTGHSAFDLSSVSRGTCKMGYMVPIYITDVLPSDKFRISVNEMLRFLPMIAPPMHQVKVYFDYFFVPNRLIWDNWEVFRTGGKDGTNTSVPPYIVSPSGGFSPSSLPDYFNMPTGVAGKKMSALPFRAHNLIYNYFVRDENMGAERVVPTTDGLDTTSDLTLFKRCWPRDYFFGLPDRQRGNPTYLPLGTQAPVVGNGKALGLYTGSGSGLNPFSIAQSNANNGTIMGLSSGYGSSVGASAGIANPTTVANGYVSAGVVKDPDNSGLVANLTTATAASVDDVRTAFQTQLIKQLLMRAGYRYREFLIAFFGTDAGDGRLQWPTYIGGMASDVLFSEVLQTSSSDNVTPQGNMAGHGVSATSTQRLKYKCPEDGWIIGYMSIVPKPCYQQGLPRMYTRETRYDYYNPLFAHLGEKLVLNEELYCDGSSNDKGGFCYQPQYEEYRRSFDTSHGLMRSSAKYWAFDRIFASLPQFNQNFLECTPSLAPFVDQNPNSDNIVYAVQTIAKASRPVSRLGTPGFTDHYF